jgi:hypothetical protein
VPFIIDRFHPNLYCMYRFRSEWHAAYFSHPTSMRGRYAGKTVSASRVRCPSLLTDFKLTCPASSVWAGSAIWHIPVSPIHCEKIHGGETLSVSKVPFITDWFQPNFLPTPVRGDVGTKNVSASWVKYPSLLTGFNLTCTACSACAGGAMCHISVTPL